MMDRIAGFLRRLWRAAADFADITDRRHIFLLSAGIAFNQLLCLIPFVLVAVGVASSVLDEASTKESVRHVIEGLLPEGVVAAETIAGVLNEIGIVFNYGTVAGWIAGVVLVWTASALYSALRSGLNAIYSIPTPKFFLIYRLKDILLVMISVVLLTVATFVSPVLSAMEAASSGVLEADARSLVFGLTARVVSLVVTTVLFLFLYRFVPNGRMPRPVVLYSTIFAVVLWELARILFAWYIVNATSLGTFYGGYVALASIALWAYYSSLVFLIAAELGQFAHERYGNRLWVQKRR
jgi:membrane protein